METSPLLGQFLPQERAAHSSLVKYESSKLKSLCNDGTDFLPTSSQEASSENSINGTRVTEERLCALPQGNYMEPSDATYWKLLRNNRPYLLYITSYFLDRVGEWFTYVATINAITHICPNSNTAIAAIIAIRTIPNIMFASIGGGLADATDRRISMISLNLVGMLIVLLYLPAYHLKSSFLIYLVAFIQATVAAIYDPVRRAIIPLLVPQEEYLQKATTISEIAYATMASAGATFGGVVASEFGVSACFGKLPTQTLKE
jgi:predicted MFS family arabinose efflux permease